jgi:hypothetical protein
MSSVLNDIKVEFFKSNLNAIRGSLDRETQSAIKNLMESALAFERSFWLTSDADFEAWLQK